MSLTRIYASTSNGELYNFLQPNNSNLSGGSGGSVAKANSTPIVDGVAVDRQDLGVFGSTVIDTDDTAGATGGTFAYNNQSPIAKRVTTKINTSNNNVLRSGASQPELIQSIHTIKISNPMDPASFYDGVKTRKITSAIRGGAFNLYTGKFASGYPAESNDFFFGSDSASGDKSAKPTRAVPGSLSFKGQSPTVQTVNYKEKTG